MDPIQVVLTTMPMLEPADLKKVRAMLDHLTGEKSGETEAPGTAQRASLLWGILQKEAARNGLSYPSSGSVLRGRSRAQLIDAADAIDSFLNKVDPTRARPSAAGFIVKWGFSHVVQKTSRANWRYVLACFSDFPAFLCESFPGVSNPKHFDTVYKLYRKGGGAYGAST